MRKKNVTNGLIIDILDRTLEQEAKFGRHSDKLAVTQPKVPLHIFDKAQHIGQFLYLFTSDMD